MINVLQLLENSAKKWPERIALEDSVEAISYDEYLERARKVGSYIINNYTHGTAGKPVVVLIDRNIKSIYTFAGVVYSGNFYVPIDTTMPEERVKLIFDKLSPVAVIDARNSGSQVYDATHVDEIIIQTGIDNFALEQVRANAIDTDPLYAIFTSGSTGVPKGVLISHRSVIDLVEAFDTAFGFKEGTKFGNQAPFDFDVSTKDIYNSLYCGGCISVIPKKCFAAPKLLGNTLSEKNIDTIIWAVSAMRIIGDYKVFDAIEELPQLENVMFSGEVMPIKTLNYWMEKLPTARYVNLYGPTEITCNCTYHVVDPNRKYENVLPIGKAFANTRVFLRNVSDDEKKIGEICVEGTCLALGYWGDAEKTAQAFFTIPGTVEYSRRAYATGDMGYYDESGELCFASRKDYQIKHMGHRIELGEIEAVLNSIDFLTISVCVYDETREKIVCFYEAASDCKKEIVLELEKKLPKYMWPNVFTRYEKLPMNKNGKIDRVRLKKELEPENGTVN